MNIKAEILKFSKMIQYATDIPWKILSMQGKSNQNGPYHCHETWELRFFLSEERNQIELIDFIPPRQWHHRIDISRKLLTHTLLVSEKALWVRHINNTIGALKSPYGELLLPLLVQLQQTTREEDRASVFEECQLLLALIYRTIDPHSSIYPADKMDDFIAKLENAYYDSTLSITQLAEDSGYSPNYIQKIFRFKTGMTPRQYLIVVRMKKATQLLACGGYSIKEVAALCGFSSRQYFANAFYRYYGYAPGSLDALKGSAKEKNGENSGNRRKTL